MAKTGILKVLAEKYGVDTSELKSRIMKVATGVYKKMKAELGVSKLPAQFYRKVLKYALPAVWKIVKEEQRIPTVDEVYKIVVAEWPTWRAEAERLLQAKTAAMTA